LYIEALGSQFLSMCETFHIYFCFPSPNISTLSTLTPYTKTGTSAFAVFDPQFSDLPYSKTLSYEFMGMSEVFELLFCLTSPNFIRFLKSWPWARWNFYSWHSFTWQW